jgi:hypothetical protein
MRALSRVVGGRGYRLAVATSMDRLPEFHESPDRPWRELRQKGREDLDRVDGECASVCVKRVRPIGGVLRGP